jgi:hypothetical protein
MLVRYWLIFDGNEIGKHFEFGLGFGVTAYDLDDAISLISIAFGLNRSTIPPILSVKENVKYEDLEDNHVKKNMGSMAVRGIWYPNVPTHYISSRL